MAASRIQQLRDFLARCTEKSPIILYALRAVRATDGLLAFSLLVVWTAVVGVPMRLLWLVIRPFVPSSPAVLFLTSEGEGVAPARVRSYHFSESLARHGQAVAVFSFWRDLLGIEGLPKREPFEVERMLLALRAFHMLLLRRHRVILAQRPMHDVVTLLLLRWFDRPRIISDIDDWILESFCFYPVRVKHTLWLVGWLSELCVVASRHLEENLSRHFPRVQLVPTFVDIERFQPGASPREDGTVVFGWNGTLYHQFNIDGLDLLLEAFRRCHAQLQGRVAVRFEILAGAFPGEIAKLEALLRGAFASVPVVLLGWRPANQIPAYLHGLDVGLYVLTERLSRPKETEWAMNFQRSKSPTKLFEYMASGLAVISTRLGEAGQVVEPGVTGLLGDEVDEIADHMVTLACDDGLRRSMGRVGRQRCVERYALDRAGAELAAILRGLEPASAPASHKARS